MTPTPEQLAIIAAARETTDNLLISALAGAAKTSTLVLVAEALPNTMILCLAFNKRIAEEMKEHLPANCESMTLNSLGHRVWGQALGKRLRVDAKKNYNILSALIADLSKREKEEAWENFAEILKAIGTGKSSGYIPTGCYPDAKALMKDDEFFASLDEEPTDLMAELIGKASRESLKQAHQGLIDFDDQILLPTVSPCSFPQYPLVMIDEAQDLSALNHSTLRKLARKRLIAVGDECQAIYGFRGAHGESMKELEQQFSMKRLILSVSFRCSQSVVEAARWRAPHMQFPEWAKPGEVLTLNEWSVENLPNTATILCRNNAPIFSMAIKLLKNGRYPEIVGNDLGKSLIKTMKKFGEMNMPREQVHQAIDQWKFEKLKKSRNAARVEDQAECFRVFSDQGETLADAIVYAEYIFTAKGPITMMTIHKGKGLEFEDVFILDRELIRLTEQQEQNLLYVAQTRAKNKLTYVSTAGFQGD